MSATKPAAGHGVQLAVELDSAPGVPNAAVFTSFISITNALPRAFSREAADVGAHSDTVDVHIISNYLKREPIAVEGNLLFGNSVHDAIIEAMFGLPVDRGWKITGPPGDTAQVLIFSGGLINLSIEDPVKTGARMLKFTLRPSGPMKYGTVIYS